MDMRENEILKLWRLVNNELQGLSRPEARFGEIQPYFHSNMHPTDIAFAIVKNRCVSRMNSAKTGNAPKA
jgi:hypothetical protein